MRSYDNPAGGQTIELGPEDDLAQVPHSHRDMLTADLLEAFRDPASYFLQSADRCQIPPLAQWLKALTAEGQWRLLLHEGFMFDRSTLAAFYWRSSTVQSAMISLPQKSLSPRLPDAFRRYYSIVDVIHWDSFGYSGGVLGSQQHVPLIAFQNLRPKRKGFDPKKCVVWGNSASGDMLIHNDAGKSGFCSHENGKVQVLGTIEQALDWVFGQLLSGRTPEFKDQKA